MICLNDRDVSVYDHLHRRIVDWQLNVIEMINCKLISIPAVNGRQGREKKQSFLSQLGKFVRFFKKKINLF